MNRDPVESQGRVGQPTGPRKALFGLNLDSRDWPRIMDAVSDYVTVLDPDQHIVYCNASCGDLTGKAPHEMIGRHCWEVFHGTDAPLPECPFKRLRKSQHRESMELERDGRWYQVTVDSLAGYDNDRIGAVHIIRDITAQKRTAEALQHSIAKLHVICNHTPDPIVLKDRDSRLVMANPATVSVVGKPLEEILGRSDLEFFDNPAIGRAILGNDRRIMEQGQSETIEEVVDTSAGRRVFLATKSPWRDTDGNIIGIIGIARDITERREAQDRIEELNRDLEKRIKTRTAKLLESEARYRSLLETTSDIPFRINAEGVVTYIGPQVTRYGLDAAAMEGRPFLERIHPDDQPAMRAAFERTLASGEALSTQFRIEAPTNRTVYWFEERGTTQHDAAGQLVGVTGVLRDITERKEEERIRQEQRERLHELAAKLASAQDDEQRRIAHGLHDDVAQLLTAALMKMAVARRTAAGQEAESIHRELEDLLRQANRHIRLLSFELASSTLYRFGIEEALDELCDGMSQRYGIRIDLQTDRRPKPLDEAAATVLFKAVRELLFNVVKHANVREATVHLHRTNDTIQLAVEDSGMGFAGFTADDDQGKPGKGLGLFEVRERLTDLGGWMNIESKPEHGTCVTLWVPLTPGNTAPATKTPLDNNTD